MNLNKVPIRKYQALKTVKRLERKFFRGGKKVPAIHFHLKEIKTIQNLEI